MTPDRRAAGALLAAALLAAALVTATLDAACSDVVFPGGGGGDAACGAGACSPDGGGATLALIAVDPPRGSSTGATVIKVKGRAFAPGARLSLAGAPVADAHVVGTDVIAATAPARPGACGPVAVAVANPDGGAVSAPLFTYVPGSLAFAEPIDGKMGLRPGRFVLADLDGDHHPDLIALDVNPITGDTSLLVALGRGDGGFGPPAAYALGPSAVDVAVADLDHDGRPDVVVALYGGSAGGQIGGYLNLGGGKLSPVRLGAPPVAGAHIVALTAADLDGDGKADVAAVLTSPALLVATGLGDGRFQTAATYPLETASSAVGVVSADFDRDGRADLAVSGGATGRLLVWMGKGEAAFKGLPAVDTGGTSAASLLAADLDGDTLPDLVTADYKSSAVSVLHGNGDGTFAPRKAALTSVAEDRLALGDVNCDGLVDVLAFGAPTAALLVGHGDGSFDGARVLTAAVDGMAAAIADLDGDGRGDLVLTHLAPGDPNAATPLTTLHNTSL